MQCELPHCEKGCARVEEEFQNGGANSLQSVLVLEVEVLDVKVPEVLVLQEDVLGRLVEVLEVFVPNVLVLDVEVLDVEVLDVEVLDVLVYRGHGDANKLLAGFWLSRMPYQKRNL